VQEAQSHAALQCLQDLDDAARDGFLAWQAVTSPSMFLSMASQFGAFQAREAAARDAAAGHSFVQPGHVSGGLPAPDKCMQCGQRKDLHGQAIQQPSAAAAPPAAPPAQPAAAPVPEAPTGQPAAGDGEDQEPEEDEGHEQEVVNHLACGDTLGDVAAIEPGTRVRCPRHGEVAVITRDAWTAAALDHPNDPGPTTTGAQDAAAFSAPETLAPAPAARPAGETA
jgi:hypothetical protein